MNLIKRLIPNYLKQKGKYFLYSLLRIPYSNFGVPVEILKWLPKNKPIIFFDIGASVGNFSLGICAEYHIEKGILVEPISKIVPILKKKFPDRETFQILNIAISDADSEGYIYINDEFDSISSLLKIYRELPELASLNIKETTAAKIKTSTLDHIAREQRLSHIDLIKIDVQGAEHLVLRAGIETLKMTKLVYTEFSFKPLYEKSSTFFDLYKIFYQNDFILANISPGYTSANGELLQGDALFVNKKSMN